MSPNLEGIDAWLRVIKVAAKKQETTKTYQPSVQELANLIETDGVVRRYVTEMINQVPDEFKTVSSIEEMLDMLYSEQSGTALFSTPGGDRPRSRPYPKQAIGPTGEDKLNLHGDSLVAKAGWDWRDPPVLLWAFPHYTPDRYGIFLPS